jgi:hypothetical protein
MSAIYFCCSVGFGLLSAINCGYENVPREGTRGQKAMAFAVGLVNPGIPYGVLAGVVWPVIVAFAAFLGFLSCISPR